MPVIPALCSQKPAETAYQILSQSVDPVSKSRKQSAKYELALNGHSNLCMFPVSGLV